MVIKNLKKNSAANPAMTKEAWLAALSDLVERIEARAKRSGWAVRRLDKPMDNSEMGGYSAPSLLMQKEFDRALLEPVTHSAVGDVGVVDLYRLPAYDDIAHLYYWRSAWHHAEMTLEAPRFEESNGRPSKLRPLTAEVIDELLQAIAAHGG